MQRCQARQSQCLHLRLFCAGWLQKGPSLAQPHSVQQFTHTARRVDSSCCRARINVATQARWPDGLFLIGPPLRVGSPPQSTRPSTWEGSADSRWLAYQRPASTIPPALAKGSPGAPNEDAISGCRHAGGPSENRSKTMVPKKPDRKPMSRGRLSLVSPLLEGALRDTPQLPSGQEPWRNRKVNGKNRGKRKR